MAARPVVGVVGWEYTVTRHWGELPVSGTPTPYLDHVADAGAVPVVLSGHRAESCLGAVDALVLTGGGDVDPATYGGETGDAVDVDRARDYAELALVAVAASAGIPLLGVCRGLQLLVVAFGGTLTADLGAAHVLPGRGHPVRTAPGSLLHDAVGPRPRTSSLHHQAVADPGPAWVVTARADDGTIEAVEWAGRGDWPVLAVQWHPELDGTGAALFGWLTEQAAQRGPARGERGRAGTAPVSAGTAGAAAAPRPR